MSSKWHDKNNEYDSTIFTTYLEACNEEGDAEAFLKEMKGSGYVSEPTTLEPITEEILQSMNASTYLVTSKQACDKAQDNPKTLMRAILQFMEHVKRAVGITKDKALAHETQDLQKSLGSKFRPSLKDLMNKVSSIFVKAIQALARHLSVLASKLNQSKPGKQPTKG